MAENKVRIDPEAILAGAAAIPETLSVLGGNAFFDFGSFFGEAVADPFTWGRGFWDRDSAAQFRSQVDARRERLPQFEVSAPTAQVQQAVTSPIMEELAKGYKYLDAMYPNEVEAVRDYITDPRVMHTLESTPVGVGANQLGKYIAKDIAQKTANTVGDMLWAGMVANKTPGSQAAGVVVPFTRKNWETPLLDMARKAHDEGDYIASGWIEEFVGDDFDEFTIREKYYEELLDAVDVGDMTESEAKQSRKRFEDARQQYFKSVDDIIADEHQTQHEAIASARQNPTPQQPQTVGGVLNGKMSQYSEKYPDTAEPVLMNNQKDIDKAIDAGKKPPAYKEWLAKGTDADTQAFLKERNRVQKEMDRDGYEPYFDPEKRYDANPDNYDVRADTRTEGRYKKPETEAAWKAKIDTPEARQRLQEAFDVGRKQGGNDAWYKMGQLEDKFIEVYGPEKGPQMFRERFSDAMAATTGGADPKGNLISAVYGNYLRQRGMSPPKNAYDMPVPVGGRFISGNMEMYDKVTNQGRGLGIDQPKRHNFSSNFEGNADLATIDEQMTQLITPGSNAPPGNTYGIYEDLVREVAAENGVSARDFQDVVWGGAKFMKDGKYQGKSMIEVVNEAIERTARMTGMDPEEVLVRGIIKGEIPIYTHPATVAGAAALGAAAMSDE